MQQDQWMFSIVRITWRQSQLSPLTKFSSLVYCTSFKQRMTDQVAHRNGSAKLCRQLLQPNVLVLWPAPDLLHPQRLRSGKIEVQ